MLGVNGRRHDYSSPREDPLLGILGIMDENKPQIDFVESCQAHGASGGARAASCYIFQVDDRRVAVEIPRLAELTRDGVMPQEDVKRAAKSFLEAEIEGRGLTNLPDSVVLDSPTMDSVLNRLGLAPRFKR